MLIYFTVSIKHGLRTGNKDKVYNVDSGLSIKHGLRTVYMKTALER